MINLIINNKISGPFTNLILKEHELRLKDTKKNNKNNKMSVKVINSSKDLKVKSDKSIVSGIDLIKDSDSDNESIETIEPDNKSPEKKTKKTNKEVYPQLGTEDFKSFMNLKKQKPIVESDNDEESIDLSDLSDNESIATSSISSKSSESNQSEMSNKKSKISKKEIERRKQEILIKLAALEKKGVKLSKNYTLKSSLEELEFEYNTQKNQAEQEASIHFQQKILMAAVTGAEFLNKKFDPIGAKLDGWSESVMDNITDYEEIFRQLHEKYKQKASMPPELQLLITLVGSGFMFHLTQSLFKTSLPGLGDVLKSNPDIMNNISSAMGKVMNNAHGLNPQKTNNSNNTEFTGPSIDLSSLMGNIASSMNSGIAPGTGPIGGNQGPNRPVVQQAPKIDDSDRFSVVSSSSSTRSSTKEIKITTKTKGKGKNTKNIKSIEI